MRASSCALLLSAVVGCAPHVTPNAIDASGDDGDGGTATDAAAADAAPDAGPAGMLLFDGTFETGNLSGWTVEECMPGRITVYSAATAAVGDPAPHQGTYAAHFHVLDTDTNATPNCTSTDNPRAQLSSPATLLDNGDDRWEAWSTYFPASFPAIKCPTGTTTCTAPFFVLQEDYGAPYGVAPWIAWDVLQIGGVNSLAFQYSTSTDHPTTAWSTPLVTGAWIDFLVHKRLSNTATGGLVEAWVNGAPITFSTCNCTQLTGETMNSNQTDDSFFLNAYRAHSMFPTVDIYFDAARVGTTRSSVTD